MEPTPVPVPPEPPPRSRVRGCLGWILAGLAASTVLSVVVAVLAWRSMQDAVQVPSAAFLEGLRQSAGQGLPEDVQETAQQVTRELVATLEDPPAAPAPPAARPVDAGAPAPDASRPADPLPVDAGRMDAAHRAPRERPDPAVPVAWYDDEGQAHITLPEAVPLKYRAALGLD